MIDALFATVTFWTALRNRLARAMPAYGLFQSPLKKLLVAMLVGVQVMLCKSIHSPLSLQYEPRIGTTIPSVGISFPTFWPAASVVPPGCAATPPENADTAPAAVMNLPVRGRR